MIATLGDLVEDVVVRLRGPIRPATDTAVTVARRRGGSAANVAAVAAGLAGEARFVGQVGEDPVGASLVSDLQSAGVDTSCVRRRGTTGTIVVIVDRSGERSMLTDRRTCLDLDAPDPAWLDDVDVLHVPLYSLTEPPLSDTAVTVVGWAHDRGARVAIDVSSVALIDGFGAEAARRLLHDLEPAVVFANEDEARALAIDGPLADAVTVVKRGRRPAVVHSPGHQAVHVPTEPLDRVNDTTGAGDAFAAGFLVAGLRDPSTWRADPGAATRAGHRAAAQVLRSR